MSDTKEEVQEVVEQSVEEAVVEPTPEVVEEKPKKKSRSKKSDWYEKEGKKLVASGAGAKKFVSIALKAYGHDIDYATAVRELELVDLIKSGDFEGICKKLKIK